MQRVSIGIAVILLAALSGVGAKVEANGAEKASPPAAGPVPACLKPVPMDEPDAAGSADIAIDIPVNGTIYPPDLIPPQFAWRDEQPSRHGLAHRDSSSAKRLDRSRSGQPARKCKSAPSTKP